MSEQKPLNSGFNSATRADEVIRDLTGRTAIVTGGYSGLGLETVRVFASAGAKVIVPARDLSRARAAVGSLGEVLEMDLLDRASISRFADTVLARGVKIDLLVNNAAVMAIPSLELDSRGYEKQFATNHLGHFQLALQLKPALARGSRIVAVSSLGHRYSPVVFDDIHFANRPYDPWGAYGQSKTANILFALEADRRWRGDGVRAFSLHPGSIAGTGLQKFLPNETLISSGILDAQGNPVRDPSRNLKTVEQGAATTVWCAVSPRLDGMGGLYCENCDVAPIMEGEIDRSNASRSRSLRGVVPYAVDPALASRLWSVSENLLDMADR